MIGIALGLACLAGAAFGWPMVIALGLVAATVAVSGARSGGRWWLAVAVVAAVAGAWRSAPARPVAAPAWAGVAEEVVGVVAAAPVATGRWQRFSVEVETYRQGDAWRPGGGRVCVAAGPYPIVSLGDRVRLTGAPRRIDDGSAANRAFLRSRGCGATMFARGAVVERTGSGWRRAVAGFRRGLTATLRRAAPGDAGALLSGLVTGDDHALSGARDDAFVATGTSHVTAVSGSNLALLVVVLSTAGGLLGVGRHVGWQALVVAGVWGYAVLVGLEPPAVRAALVATGVVLAARFGRRADVVTLIVLAAAAMVLVRPDDLWSLSFRLSFAASLALAVVAAPPEVAPREGLLLPALIATLAAQLATLPVLLPVFGTVSLVGVPANLLIAPAVAVAFPLAALAALVGVVSYPLAEAIAFPARLAAEAILRVVDALGEQPRAVQAIGELPPAAGVLVGAGVALVLAAVSRDGRAWARRLPSDLRDLPNEARLIGVGLAAGGLLGLAGLLGR